MGNEDPFRCMTLSFKTENWNKDEWKDRSSEYREF